MPNLCPYCASEGRDVCDYACWEAPMGDRVRPWVGACVVVGAVTVIGVAICLTIEFATKK